MIKNYEWLSKESPPSFAVEALRLYGTLEDTSKEKSNPVITSWAKELGGPVGDWYKDDAEAWCGLFLGVCMKRAGYDTPKGFDVLRALKWAEWGQKIKTPMLWDILVFKRNGGGHVGVYIGEDKTAFHVLGGNQSNSVSITRILKSRLYSCVRCKYVFKDKAAKIRKVVLSQVGKISENEA